jgi:hypothetical protein
MIMTEMISSVFNAVNIIFPLLYDTFRSNHKYVGEKLKNVGLIHYLTTCGMKPGIPVFITLLNLCLV